MSDKRGLEGYEKGTKEVIGRLEGARKGARGRGSQGQRGMRKREVRPERHRSTGK